MRSNILPARKRHIVARPFPRSDLSSPFRKREPPLEGEPIERTSGICFKKRNSRNVFRAVSQSFELTPVGSVTGLLSALEPL